MRATIACMKQLEYALVRVSFLIKLQARVQVFPREFCEIF